MKDKIKQALRAVYGEFESILEHEYEEIITDKLMNERRQSKQKWATYNQVIIEFKNTLKDDVKVKELQYWLTDEKDPNSVCISAMEEVKDRSPELQRLYEKIMNFK